MDQEIPHRLRPPPCEIPPPCLRDPFDAVRISLDLDDHADERAVLEGALRGATAEAPPCSGALAVIAHVDRAWTTSFSWTGESQPEVFKSTLTKLLDGEPIGWCMKYLNTRHAELSVELCGLFQNRQNLVPVDQEQLSRVWRANNDARNFIVLGDPAVRLTVPPSSRQGTLRDGAKRDSRRIG